MLGVTPRQLEGLIRLSEAAARSRLSDTVDVRDAQIAIELSKFCWKQVGYDPESGRVDLDKFQVGMTSSKRDKYRFVLGSIPVGEIVFLENVYKVASAQGISDLECDEIMESLRKQGDVFAPRPGQIKRL
jgi:replicative DNA helicase Mcm